MKDVIFLLFDLLTTLTKLLRPGGGGAVIAENLLLKQQLIIHRTRQARRVYLEFLAPIAPILFPGQSYGLPASSEVKSYRRVLGSNAGARIGQSAFDSAWRK